MFITKRFTSGDVSACEGVLQFKLKAKAKKSLNYCHNLAIICDRKYADSRKSHVNTQCRLNKWGVS